MLKEEVVRALNCVVPRRRRSPRKICQKCFGHVDGNAQRRSGGTRVKLRGTTPTAVPSQNLSKCFGHVDGNAQRRSGTRIKLRGAVVTGEMLPKFSQKTGEMLPKFSQKTGEMLPKFSQKCSVV